jgi:hypothetical protein
LASTLSTAVITPILGWRRGSGGAITAATPPAATVVKTVTGGFPSGGRFWSPAIAGSGNAVAAAVAAIFPAPGTGAALTAWSSSTTTAIAATASAAAAITTTAAVAAAILVATAAAAAAAASVTTTTAVAAAILVATAAAAAAATGFSLVDAKGATHQFSALKRLDGPLFAGLICHLHKGEPPLATGVALEG